MAARDEDAHAEHREDEQHHREDDPEELRARVQSRRCYRSGCARDEQYVQNIRADYVAHG